MEGPGVPGGGGGGKERGGGPPLAPPPLSFPTSGAVSEGVDFTLESPSPVLWVQGVTSCTPGESAPGTAGGEGGGGKEKVWKNMTDLQRYLEGLPVAGGSLNTDAGMEELPGGKEGGSEDASEGDGECYLGEEVLGGGAVAVVNLDRKPQRWQYVRQTLRAAGVTRFARVSAADGRSLRGDAAALQWLFRRNHFKVLLVSFVY